LVRGACRGFDRPQRGRSNASAGNTKLGGHNVAKKKKAAKKAVKKKAAKKKKK
jgi:hypothetical protein